MLLRDDIILRRIALASGISMKTSLHVLCLYCAMTAVAFISLILINEPAAAADANFACGGSVEAEVWEAWDENRGTLLTY